MIGCTTTTIVEMIVKIFPANVSESSHRRVRLVYENHWRMSMSNNSHMWNDFYLCELMFASMHELCTSDYHVHSQHMTMKVMCALQTCGKL